MDRGPVLAGTLFLMVLRLGYSNMFDGEYLGENEKQSRQMFPPMVFLVGFDIQ